MKFYLQTLKASDFLEVNQAITLAGVYTEPADFSHPEVNVNETLKSLLDVMSESQTILVYGIAHGFRSILEEGKHLQALSRQLILTVPADGQGFMALKASKRMSIPLACARIFSVEQAAIAIHNQAHLIVLNLDQISRYADAKTILCEVLAQAEDSADFSAEDVLAVCSNTEQLRLAMSSKAPCISAPKAVYDQILYSVLTASETATARDEWILAYTRTEVLDPEEK